MPRSCPSSSLVCRVHSVGAQLGSQEMASVEVNGLSATNGSPRKRPRIVPAESKAIVILGAQWGDEGKGKVVDMLAETVDIVCRCQVSSLLAYYW